MLLRVILPAQELDLEVDLSESIEVLRNQVYSLTEIQEEDLVLILEGIGVLKEDQDLTKVQENAKLYVRKRVKELPVTWIESCTALFVEDPALQPTYNSEGLMVCGGCVTLCRDGFSNDVEIHSGPIRCQCLSSNPDCLFACRKEEWFPPDQQQIAREKLELECSTLWKQYYEEHIQRFTVHIRRLRHVVLKFEDEDLTRSALHTIPQNIQDATGNTKLELLLTWFKTDFFQWISTPICTFCSNSTRLTGTSQPTEDEFPGLPSTIELYTCPFTHQTRFPRFHHPGRLLETRKGRWIEWAICSGLMLKSLGFEVRLVSDCEERMWNEVWDREKERWVHWDAVEGKSDCPLMYSEGQKREMEYVIAVDVGGVKDVTNRYAGMNRKTRGKVPEPWIKMHLNEVNIQAKAKLPADTVQLYEQRDREEDVELAQGMKDPAPHQPEPMCIEPTPPTTPPAVPSTDQPSLTVDIPSSPSPSLEEVKTPSSSSSQSDFKVTFEAAFRQVTQGCSAPTCSNPLCAKCPEAPQLSPSQAAAMVLKLLKTREFHFCP